MRRKFLLISLLTIIIFQILCPSIIALADNSTNGDANTEQLMTEVSVKKVWLGTDNPENYRATFKLYQEVEDLGDVIEINSVEDFVKFAKGDMNNSISEYNYEERNIVLNTDLDFSNYTYDGINSFPQIENFAGNFYGQNHEIKNIHIESDKEFNGGIFSNIIEAKIKDLTVSGTAVAKCGYFGGIVGKMEESQVINCHSNVNFEIVEEEKGEEDDKYDFKHVYIGGIVGYSYNGKITNCSNSADFSFKSELEEDEAKYVFGGFNGIVSRADSTDIVGCHNSGNIEIESSHYDDMGGIAGSIYLGSTIRNCYNVGTIDVKGTQLYSSACLGGIVGQNEYESSVVDSHNEGGITLDANGTFSYVGGICGKNEEVIDKCYNNGSITINNYRISGNWTAVNAVGGIAGENDSNGRGTEIIKNCYNMGVLCGFSECIGGILGQVYDNQLKITDYRIINCFNRGNIYAFNDDTNPDWSWIFNNGETFLGGIIGSVKFLDDKNSDKLGEFLENYIYCCYNASEVSIGDRKVLDSLGNQVNNSGYINRNGSA